MNAPAKTISSRALQLRARCAAERDQLTEELAEIERSFQAADAVLVGIRDVIVKPTFIISSLAMLVLGRRHKWWSLFNRGLFWFTTGRRLYQMFKQNK